MIFTSIFSNYQNEILIKSILYIRYLIFFIAIIILFNMEEMHIKTFFYGLTLSFMLIFIANISMLIFNYSLDNITFLSTSSRFSGIFGDENILGSFITKFYFVWLALFIYIFGYRFQFYIILFTILSIFFIFLSVKELLYFVFDDFYFNNYFNKKCFC